MFKALLCRNGFGITRKSPTPKLDPLFYHWPFPFPLRFLCTSTTTTSDSDPHSSSFVVSYLINNLGFSPESALKASKQVHFKTSEKPDSVLSFFRTHGFPDSDIPNIIKRHPWLLSCDPNKRVLPKFKFLLSKGASASDIVRIAGRNRNFVKLGLVNQVIPTYKLLRRFLQSDENTIASIITYAYLLSSDSLAPNIKLLVDSDVASSSIYRILRVRPNVICNRDLGKFVDELKRLGFDASKTYFGDALLAKTGTSNSRWNEKIETYKRWGWSEETVLEMVRRQPKCMLASTDKINRVMQFWVNQLGWDSSYLVKGPGIFSYSFEKRVVPRALVIHYLLSKGLVRKTASLVSPFFMSDKLFLQKYVECFEEEEASLLLKLYHGKVNMEDDKRAQENRWHVPFIKYLTCEKCVIVVGWGVTHSHTQAWWASSNE